MPGDCLGLSGERQRNETMEEEDERREAAIASAPSLQPNFRTSGATQAQLSKFHELHRRRLQIKAKSKVKTRSKGIVDENSKTRGKGAGTRSYTDDNLPNAIQDPNVCISQGSSISSLHQDDAAVQVAPKKRQKLPWGLDTKERWERKSNM